MQRDRWRESGGGGARHGKAFNVHDKLECIRIGLGMGSYYEHT